MKRARSISFVASSMPVARALPAIPLASYGAYRAIPVTSYPGGAGTFTFGSVPTPVFVPPAVPLSALMIKG